MIGGPKYSHLRCLQVFVSVNWNLHYPITFRSVLKDDQRTPQTVPLPEDEKILTLRVVGSDLDPWSRFTIKCWTLRPHHRIYKVRFSGVHEDFVQGVEVTCPGNCTSLGDEVGKGSILLISTFA